jgi:hypothetical protein
MRWSCDDGGGDWSGADRCNPRNTKDCWLPLEARKKQRRILPRVSEEA